jgi:hypothetical protein
VVVKKVNYDDRSSLVEALKGQDVLVITLGVFAAKDTQIKLFDAAGEANIPWVLPNEWGWDADKQVAQETIIGAQKIKEREYLESLGKISWIGIACSFWYEFSLGGTADRYGFDFNNKSVIFFDDGTTRICTSTLPQCGRAVAALLSLKVLPEDENDESPCLSDWRNKFVHFDSFTLTQKDMFASVLRVTGDKESDWKIGYEPVKERYAKGMEVIQNRSFYQHSDEMRIAALRVLYGRAFFPDAPIDFERHHSLDNNKLGLPRENLDEWTKKAIEIGTGDFMQERYSGKD